jgi:hypothetical protein
VKTVRHIPDDVDNDEAKHQGSIIYKLSKRRLKLLFDENQISNTLSICGYNESMRMVNETNRVILRGFMHY